MLQRASSMAMGSGGSQSSPRRRRKTQTEGRERQRRTGITRFIFAKRNSFSKKTIPKYLNRLFKPTKFLDAALQANLVSRTLSSRGALSSLVKFYSSRRQESHMQRRRATGAGAGARGRGPHHPRSLERARREMSHLLVVLSRPGN